MELKDYLKARTDYMTKVEARDAERMTLGSGVDDTPYFVKILEEMVIDFMERLDKIEELLTPQDEAADANHDD